MRLLLTGFEPFDGSTLNPSQSVVQALAAAPPVGVQLHTAILPVERLRGPLALLQALQAVQPEAVICLGEASRRAAISIERLAVNLLDYRIPDNQGVQVVDEAIRPDGPAAYFATLPVRRMLQAVEAVGVPVGLSLSAGTFLCNQVLYTLLDHLALAGSDIPAGFIHLPALPEQAAVKRPPIPSMSLETMVTGIRAAIAVL
jgi:pyroglutamyl-peptidase